MYRPQNFIVDYSSIDAIKAKVELYNGSTLVKTCTCSDNLQSFSVSRVGESGKLFGYYICQQLKLTLIDLDGDIDVNKGQIIRISYGVKDLPESEFFRAHPDFFVEEISRHQDTNTIDIIAYDAFYNANKIKYLETEEVEYMGSYNPKSIYNSLDRCLNALGVSLPLVSSRVNSNNEDTYDNEPNIDENTTVADVIKAYAQVKGGILHLDVSAVRLSGINIGDNNTEDYVITKEQYLSLQAGKLLKLDGIAHITELGDNVGVGETNGLIQYIRSNPWWEANPDRLVEELDSIWANVDGETAQEFELTDWLGNFCLQPCDKIAIEKEDGSYIYSFILDDTITFDGTLSQTSRWSAEMSGEETAINPANLGEMLNETYAKVDKVNRKIEMAVKEADAQSDRISALELNSADILMTVSEVQKETEETKNTLNKNFETLSKQVSMKMTADDVQIKIDSALKNGIDKVETSTGFTFNEAGLNISKSGSEMTTQITEDGMKVSRSGQETLVADNTGVKAENLHATTYLRIGNNSRLSDWGNRAACFWVGG